VLVDERIGGGSAIARDVEQAFDAGGSHGMAWCGLSPVAQLMGDLRSMVAEFSGRKYLSTYLYRVVLQNDADGRVHLQAIDPTEGIPDTLPLSLWTGLSGAKAKLLLGGTVRVAFVAGDPAQPLVDSYAPGLLPLESTIDASVSLHLGPTSPLVALAGGTEALVPAPWGAALAAALATFAGAMGAASQGPLSPLKPAATALQTALGALPPAATIRVTAS
jgi:hypothetical protein